jgi:hypothetical protein
MYETNENTAASNLLNNKDLTSNEDTKKNPFFFDFVKIVSFNFYHLGDLNSVNGIIKEFHSKTNKDLTISFVGGESLNTIEFSTKGHHPSKINYAPFYKFKECRNAKCIVYFSSYWGIKVSHEYEDSLNDAYLDSNVKTLKKAKKNRIRKEVLNGRQ